MTPPFKKRRLNEPSSAFPNLQPQPAVLELVKNDKVDILIYDLMEPRLSRAALEVLCNNRGILVRSNYIIPRIKAEIILHTFNDLDYSAIPDLPTTTSSNSDAPPELWSSQAPAAIKEEITSWYRDAQEKYIHLKEYIEKKEIDLTIYPPPRQELWGGYARTAMIALIRDLCRKERKAKEEEEL